MTGGGNGWSAGPDGTRRWGRFGAAGLLLVADPDDGDTAATVLLQHRAAWTADGDTWGIPGGALEENENAVEAALRETEEETGISPADVSVHRAVTTAGPFPKDPHRPELAGGWTYTVVLATCPGRLDVVCNNESTALEWVEIEDVAGKNLLPAFADSWPRLKALIGYDPSTGGR
ncbi:NUDIX domain-containing protein [Corynebacterium mendelii]|uniref:NUDIX hydrolase n=1 Tax=Corynebacterium mendelii TaxID=2765362 RepID=A0A939IYI1_9CORY|nr:NUDIX hydrolase [Corynebacterium mendelii]